MIERRSARLGFNPELVKTAPHCTRVGRLDEVTAARKPILRWKPQASGEAAD